VLAFVPGVTMMFDGGASRRADDHVARVLRRRRSGVREADRRRRAGRGCGSGNVDWRAFVEEIERIEVLHGPGSSLYGDTALGGVVQLSRGSKPGSGSSGELHLRGGSFDTRNADLGYLTDLGDLRSTSARDTRTPAASARTPATAIAPATALLRFGERARWRFEPPATIRTGASRVT